jgi:hypothetical protein
MANTINLSITIAGTKAQVFNTITDLPSYNTWLPQSHSFNGTTTFIPPPPAPIALGTKYIEPSVLGTRYGEVIEFNAPNKVVFSQPMTLTPAFLGLILGVKVQMEVKDDSTVGHVVVERTVNLEIPWSLRFMGGLIARPFRVESWRTMEAMKKYIETQVK